MAARRPYADGGRITYGVQVEWLPGNWRQRARHLEERGFSSIVWPDHMTAQWDPFVAAASVAAVTSTIRVGPLVAGARFRHPVSVTRMSLTAHVLSGGRFDLGLGAGWIPGDFAALGLEFAPNARRLDWLSDVARYVRRRFDGDFTAFSGELLSVPDEPPIDGLSDTVGHPRLVIGGGGRRLLGLAGELADMVSLNPPLPDASTYGRRAERLRTYTWDTVREQVLVVADAAQSAGRERPVLSATLGWVAAGRAALDIRDALSQTTGLTAGQVEASPLVALGDAADIRAKVEAFASDLDVHHLVLSTDEAGVDAFAAAVLGPWA